MKWLLGALGAGLVVILTVAASDKLFLKAVPLEQRLISSNENIRKKAQQELLGLGVEARRELTSELTPLLSEGDAFKRKWAAIALALVGSSAQEAIPALLHGVTDGEPDVAQACRVALSEIGTPDASQLPALLQGLQDSHEAVRCAAAAGLSRMGPVAREAMTPLFVQLKSSEVPECLLEATAVLIGSNQEGLSSVFSMLRDPSPDLRRRAVHLLSMLSPKSPEVWRALGNVLAQDDDRSVRWLCTRALELHKPPEPGPIPTFLQLVLHSKNEAVRAMALDQLRKSSWSPEDQVRILGRILSRDSSADLRWQAAQELAQRAPASRAATPALLRALQDDDARVRESALAALRSTAPRGHEVLPLVAKLQRDKIPEIRCMAAELLVEMGAWDRVSVRTLAGDLKMENSDHCSAEALAMDGRFNPDVVPILMHLLHEGDWETRRRTVDVLIQLGGRAKEALPLLVQAHRDGVPGAFMAIRAIRESLPAARRYRGSR